jgi:hypothetical protein
MATLDPTVNSVAYIAIPISTPMPQEAQIPHSPQTRTEIAKRLAVIGEKVLTAIRYTEKTLKSFTREICLCTPFKLAASISVILTIESLAASILNVGKDCWKSVKISAEEALDTALSIIESVGAIGDSISTFAEGLGAVGAVAVEALSWTTPLLSVSLVLETAGTVYHTKKIADNILFADRFQEVAHLNKPEAEYTLEDYTQGVELIKREHAEGRTRLNKLFGTDEPLMKRLDAIQAEAKEKLESADEAKQAEGKKLLHSTMKTLKDRLISTKLSSALSIVANTVGTIGVALLFTPAAPVGCGLLVATAMLSIATIISKEIEKARFNTALQIT